RNHFAQLFLCPPIVTVQKRHDLATALRNAHIESGSLTAVRLTYHSQPRLEFAYDFWRAISRSVIHHDNFPVRRGKILLQHAYNRLLNEPLVVIGVDQDADEGLCHS